MEYWLEELKLCLMEQKASSTPSDYGGNEEVMKELHILWTKDIIQNYTRNYKEHV